VKNNQYGETEASLARLQPEEKAHIQKAIFVLKNDLVPFKRLDICKLKVCDTYTVIIGSNRLVYDVFMGAKDYTCSPYRRKRKSLQIRKGSSST